MFEDKECEPLSADTIENWIVDWYSITFKKVGADGSEPDSSRLPPMWLADWRKVWERTKQEN